MAAGVRVASPVPTMNWPPAPPGRKSADWRNDLIELICHICGHILRVNFGQSGPAAEKSIESNGAQLTRRLFIGPALVSGNAARAAD